MQDPPFMHGLGWHLLGSVKINKNAFSLAVLQSLRLKELFYRNVDLVECFIWASNIAGLVFGVKVCSARVVNVEL